MGVGLTMMDPWMDSAMYGMGSGFSPFTSAISQGTTVGDGFLNFDPSRMFQSNYGMGGMGGSLGGFGAFGGLGGGNGFMGGGIAALMASAFAGPPMWLAMFAGPEMLRAMMGLGGGNTAGGPANNGNAANPGGAANGAPAAAPAAQQPPQAPPAPVAPPTNDPAKDAGAVNPDGKLGNQAVEPTGSNGKIRRPFIPTGSRPPKGVVTGRQEDLANAPYNWTDGQVGALDDAQKAVMRLSSDKWKFAVGGYQANGKILVVAQPIKGVKITKNDTAAAKQLIAGLNTALSANGLTAVPFIVNKEIEDDGWTVQQKEDLTDSDTMKELEKIKKDAPDLVRTKLALGEPTQGKNGVLKITLSLRSGATVKPEDVTAVVNYFANHQKVKSLTLQLVLDGKVQAIQKGGSGQPTPPAPGNQGGQPPPTPNLPVAPPPSGVQKLEDAKKYAKSNTNANVQISENSGKFTVRYKKDNTSAKATAENHVRVLKGYVGAANVIGPTPL